MPKQPKPRPALPPAEQELTPRLKEIVRAVGAKLDAEDERQRLDETQPAPSVAQAETETERPEWFDTPQIEYSLLSMGPGGGEEQNVFVSLEEFIALKRHLAQLRGLEWPAQETA
jgi:hypothetical protein